MEIEVASINSPDRDDGQLTADERAEAQRTFYVKQAGAAGGLGALIRFGMFHSASLARGIKHVFHLARFDGRELAFNLCYLIEALLLAEWVQRKCLNHLHVHFATPAATWLCCFAECGRLDSR